MLKWAIVAAWTQVKFTEHYKDTNARYLERWRIWKFCCRTPAMQFEFFFSGCVCVFVRVMNSWSRWLLETLKGVHSACLESFYVGDLLIERRKWSVSPWALSLQASAMPDHCDPLLLLHGHWTALLSSKPQQWPLKWLWGDRSVKATWPCCCFTMPPFHVSKTQHLHRRPQRHEFLNVVIVVWLEQTADMSVEPTQRWAVVRCFVSHRYGQA